MAFLMGSSKKSLILFSIFLGISWLVIVECATNSSYMQHFQNTNKETTPTTIPITIPNTTTTITTTTATSPSSAIPTMTSSATNDWMHATATWYGSVDGDGTDGGACGYGELSSSSYGSKVSAGSPHLFQNGNGCGACYQVKCVGNKACSKTPVKVVITDECPGGLCGGGNTHFDMSGSAFSAMATSELTSSLRNAGVVQILYQRVTCNYPSTNIEFYVNEGATNFWFSLLIKYVAGDGQLSVVELKEEGNNGEWEAMQELWGAYWCLNKGPLHPPFSIRLTSSSGQTVVAHNVIPNDWVPNTIYKSTINF